MKDTFARRLENARKIRRISEQQLSDLSNGKVSVEDIGNFEKGQPLPSSDILFEFMQALNFNMDYFFRPFEGKIDAERLELRDVPSLDTSEMESLKLLAVSEVEKFIEIEEILEREGISGMSNQFNLDYSDVKFSTDEDAKSVAMKLRKDLGVGLEPIASVRELLENKGVRIVEVDDEGLSDFISTSGKDGDIPVILINKRLKPEKKRMTILEELGHLILNFSQDVDSVGKDNLCKVFANEVLIPSERFVEMIGSSRHMITLKEIQSVQGLYGIDIDSLMAKAHALKVITREMYEEYLQRKGTRPLFKEAVEKSLFRYESSTLSRFERLVHRAYADEIISTSKAAVLLESHVGAVREDIDFLYPNLSTEDYI